jgi:NAD(P) transhydrogenase subunit alpha
LGGSDNYKIDQDNEVVRGALILHSGEITWPPKPVVTTAPAKTEAKPAIAQAVVAEAVKPAKKSSGLLWPLLLGSALIGMGVSAPPSFLSHLTVFVLACFVGWQVIWNVKPALHTPLMSVTNAISGIIIIGGMLQISGELTSPTTILGAIAIFLGTINISGGFLVTQRMLKMFQK